MNIRILILTPFPPKMHVLYHFTLLVTLASAQDKNPDASNPSNDYLLAYCHTVGPRLTGLSGCSKACCGMKAFTSAGVVRITILIIIRRVDSLTLKQCSAPGLLEFNDCCTNSGKRTDAVTCSGAYDAGKTACGKNLGLPY